MSIWNRFKAFMSKYDYDDVRKEVADDLKKLSLMVAALGLLSLVPRLPAVFGELPKVFGIEAAAMQTSTWVTVALFGAAFIIYVVQLVLRVKTRKEAVAVQVQETTTQRLASHQSNRHDNYGHRIADDGIARNVHHVSTHSPKAGKKNPRRKSR